MNPKCPLTDTFQTFKSFIQKSTKINIYIEEKTQKHEALLKIMKKKEAKKNS